MLTFGADIFNERWRVVKEPTNGKIVVGRVLVTDPPRIDVENPSVPDVLDWLFSHENVFLLRRIILLR